MPGFVGPHSEKVLKAALVFWSPAGAVAEISNVLHDHADEEIFPARQGRGFAGPS